ncbi:MAG: ribbon-helix-helix protein, CopG family [Actinomycetota bacterium]|nr:ribbon-helix-helix protein, CopG family [Actinomycetota bacterium]
MTEITIRVPDDVAERIATEAATKGLSAEELAREAIERYLGATRRRLSFAAMGDGPEGFSAQRAEEALEAEGFGR